ncbi:MAG TPA: hypothetical protein VGD26_01680 [Chitinophagaceae bacterium]
MTTNKTYNQLWWDEEFVEKRIQEQRAYINKFRIFGYSGLEKPYWWSEDAWGVWLPSKPIYLKKDNERVLSAKQVLLRFERQLEEIKKLKGHCCRY